MFDWIAICLAAATTALLACALPPQLRTYRSLFMGACALTAITMLGFQKQGFSPNCPRNRGIRRDHESWALPAVTFWARWIKS